MSVKILYYLICFNNAYALIPFLNIYNTQAVECATKILTTCFKSGSTITLSNLNSDITEINKAIHLISHSSFVQRNSSARKLNAASEGYYITARNLKTIVQFIVNLVKERTWNPLARFVIFIEQIKEPDLNELFLSLLKYHIINVVVIDEHYFNTFTYNPYENFGCGKRFDSITNLGHCNNLNQSTLFPNKLVTGLKNCTLRVLATHLPPYAIDPKTNITKYPGVDQCVLNNLAYLEKFEMEIDFADLAELFSTVDDDMKAEGPLNYLQGNKYDIMTGGMILIPPRANAFSYIYAHMAFYDDYRIVAPVAQLVPKWKKTYLEFQETVWITLLITFITYSITVFVLVRKSNNVDLTFVVLQLWDNLFMHGSNTKNYKFPVKCVLLLWLWFTSLVNIYYQTNLMSLTTKPGREYQVSSDEDLVYYNFKPCVSTVLQTFMNTTEKSAFENMFQFNDDVQCRDMLGSLKYTSTHKNRFSFVSTLFYDFKKSALVDEEGKPTLYVFRKQARTVLNAVFLYKGFPKTDDFNYQSLRMHEGGHIENCLRVTYDSVLQDLLEQRSKNPGASFVLHLEDLIIPHGILLIGHFISLLVFIAELCYTANM